MRHMGRVAVVVLAGFFLIFIVAVTGQEEIKGTTNITTYRLVNTEVVAEQYVNGSSFNLTLYAKASNITLQNLDGKGVGINHSVTFWRGAYIHKIVAEKETAGYLSYTLPAQKQHFVAPLKRKEVIKVILPPGYATGDSVLGLPRPKPDDIVMESDRMVLTWEDPYPKDRIIEIDYYTMDAPHALRMLMLFFLIAGVFVVVEHLLCMKQLRLFQKKLDEELQDR